jgi:CheY-like chemotaxis protein
LDQGHTGIQVISRLRELLGKDLKAVLVTGDTSTAMRHLHHDVNSRFLSKPIDSDELLTVMAELLAPR